jgi:hypothetical protein
MEAESLWKEAKQGLLSSSEDVSDKYCIVREGETPVVRKGFEQLLFRIPLRLSTNQMSMLSTNQSAPVAAFIHVSNRDVAKQVYYNWFTIIFLF